jgi:adenylate kinase family enzyme
MKQTIIHISGASGAGKTTLGKKLSDKYGSKITVKDIDDLRQEFIKHHYGKKNFTIIDKDAYQKYIDKYITSVKTILIFVGLNNMPWWHKNHYYDTHAEHKFYINLDNKVVLKQVCQRFFNNIANDTQAMDDLVNNNSKFIRLVSEVINNDCNATKNAKINNKWKTDYVRLGYQLLSREDIFKKVCKIIDKN